MRSDLFAAAVSWYGVDRPVGELTPKNPVDVIADLKCPVLLIWTDHNPGKSLAAVQHVIDTIPQKEFHLIKNAAHWAQWEKPDEVNALMIDFLNRTTP